MIIMTAQEYIRRLQILAAEPSYYDNTPGQNLLFVHEDGTRSGDCSNTIKSLLNGYDITNHTPGYFQSYLGNTGDVTTEGLLYLCSGISSDFTKLTPGRPELLHMQGHVGTYLGKEVMINGFVYNVIECTAWEGDWGRTGIIYSYVDQYGNRLNHKGGWPCMQWTSHGLFTPWLDYSGTKPTPTPTPKPTPKGPVFTYQVWDDIGKHWLPNVKNVESYAGKAGSDVDAVLISCSKGNVVYTVHTWKGDKTEKYPDSKWLKPVKNREHYAGKANRPIDAICIKSDTPAKYRVHLRKEKIWLPWVKTKNANIKDAENGYAGIIGSPIDAIQIKPIE